MSHIARTSRLHQLAASLSAAMALCGVDTSAQAATRLVGTCADTGSGSLRQVIGVAASGDTIELSGLTCSTITLTSGEIQVPQHNLIIVGPGTSALTITANSQSRIFKHTDASDGFLNVTDLTLTGGKYYSPSADASGGCIYSGANVILVRSTVSACRAITAGAAFGAAGGAVFTVGNTRLIHSRVTGNMAVGAGVNGIAQGGGVFASRTFYSNYSTISENRAYGTATGATGGGGGAFAVLAFSLVNSTVVSNQADVGAGIRQNTSGGSFTNEVIDSTISGNTANMHGGAMDVVNPLLLYNSTIAFNSAPSRAGIEALANVKTNSTIIAKNSNTSSDPFSDLYISGAGSTLTGANNLIISSNLQPPPGTLTGDPRLVPLANHGGPTLTHALSANSPAIDRGNNIVINGSFDQRGTGFAREIPSGSADIGAYERQVNDDEIFYDGFN